MAAAKKVANKQDSKRSIISKSAIVRIAKKNGAERIGKEAVTKLAEAAEKYVAELTKKAIAAATHANRKSVRADDVLFVI